MLSWYALALAIACSGIAHAAVPPPTNHHLANPTAVAGQPWAPIEQVEIPAPGANCCPVTTSDTDHHSCNFYLRRITSPGGSGAIPAIVTGDHPGTADYTYHWVDFGIDPAVADEGGTATITFHHPGTFPVSIALVCAVPERDDYGRLQPFYQSWILGETVEVSAPATAGLAPGEHRPLAYCQPPTRTWLRDPRAAEEDMEEQTQRWIACQRNAGHGHYVRQ